MSRSQSRSLAQEAQRQIDQAQRSTDIQQALDHIVRAVHSGVSLIFFPRLRVYLNKSPMGRQFKKDLHVELIERLKITPGQWDRIESLTHKWATIYEHPELTHVVQPLVQGLSDFFGCRIQSFPRQYGLFWDFSLVFPDLHLNYFDEEIHLIVVTDSRSGPNEFNTIREIIRDNDSTLKITILLIVGSGDTFRELAKTSSIEIVVLDEDDCREIILSPDSVRTFCHRVARRISVQALQPYQTQGKVRPRMFYGRQTEIKKLKNNLSSSFAVYGGRLIGKSSLLHQIGCEFEKDESKAYQVCSITAQGFVSTVEVCRAILKELNIPTGTHRNIQTFERLMRDNLASHSKKFLVLQRDFTN